MTCAKNTAHQTILATHSHFVSQCMRLDATAKNPCPNLARISFFENSTNSLQNDPLINKVIPYKMNGPTQPSFQTAFWDFYMIVLLCLNHLFCCSYNMTRCMQLPTKFPVKWALKPFKLVHATKWLAQVKWFPTKWP